MDLKEDNKDNEDHGQTGERLKSPKSCRIINSLPLNPTYDYTPYFGLEFDLSVQDYCRNLGSSTNYILRGSGDQPIKQKSGQTKHKQEQWCKFTNNSNNSSSSTYNGLVQSQLATRSSRSCKVVVSGDVAVGKTCLVNRFGHDIYSNDYQTTIGVDFDLQRFTILGQPYLLQIWDTAGLERFRCITNSYYRGCQAALLVFDMTNMSTLANVLRWKDEVLSSSKTFDQLTSEHLTGKDKTDSLKLTPQSQSGLNHQPLLFLVGTKCDLPIADSTRTFIKEQANKVASILKAELWFVSSQTGENVNELFNRVAALTFNRAILNEISRIKFETSTMGACLKEKILQKQRELWQQSSRLIKITRKKEGDDRRTKCINVQCVIK